MEKRLLSIIDTKKKKIRVTILLIVIIATMTTGTLLAFTDSEEEKIIEKFSESVNYDPDKDVLSFTIPETIPEGYKFFLHIAGLIFMDDSGMTFHPFDEESLNYTWKYGKTYRYPLRSDGLDFVALDFGLLDKNKKELLYKYTIRISADGTKIIEKED